MTFFSSVVSFSNLNQTGHTFYSVLEEQNKAIKNWFVTLRNLSLVVRKLSLVVGPIFLCEGCLTKQDIWQTLFSSFCFNLAAASMEKRGGDLTNKNTYKQNIFT